MAPTIEETLPLKHEKMPGICRDVGERCNAEIFNGSAHSLMGNSVVIGTNGYLLLGILCLIDAYFKF